ncbi:MAG: OsmC family protein [Propionibacteriaceae bacterium]|nr:OsmC family protein [Propionibacteriaceae bacterium]
MERDHHYEIHTTWQGDLGTGTSGYRAYSRASEVTAAGKLHPIAGSSDRPFHGDPERWNPEELLLAALSQCHMLSYLHVATRHGIVVTGYTDHAVATMHQAGDGGVFTEAVLRPVVTIAAGDADLAGRIHAEAGRLCFIASSVSFPVRHEPTIRVARARESDAR